MVELGLVENRDWRVGSWEVRKLGALVGRVNSGMNGSAGGECRALRKRSSYLEMLSAAERPEDWEGGAEWVR